MRLVSLFSVAAASVMWAVGIQAQTAQEVIDSTTKTYQELTSYQVQALTRSVRMMPMMMPSGYPGPGAPNYGQQSEPRYAMTNARFAQFSLKLRKPDDWSLAVQTHIPVAAVRSGSGTTRTFTPSPPIVTFESMARWETQPPEFGKVQPDGRFDLKGPPASDFIIRLRSLLSSNGTGELILAQFEPSMGGFNTARPFTVIKPEFLQEYANDTVFHVIRGKTGSGNDVIVWIDKAKLVVARALVYSRESYSGPMGAPMGPSEARQVSRTMVTVNETLYRGQVVGPLFYRTDFLLQTPSMLGAIETTTQEWMPQSALMELTELSKRPGQTTGGAPVATPAPVIAPPAAPVVIEAQALSHEQMSGIVLIEGDGGTATGFMTKIRDVDFVVTNLHVLGGNKKMSMKTLGGEEIPMLGIFGAAGSDIAIIRIANGKGDLKMAADVFKSSKIGDKVVVVGNRQGGGVATQTAGSIVGVGPTRVEVNANFEPGNSGSPIVNLSTGEVVGVASYSETRRLDVDEDGGSSAQRGTAGAAAPKVEKRWFGYRLDSIAKWEAIDLAKWNAQEDRINSFRELSEALVAVLRLEFGKARRHPRLTTTLSSFETRVRAASNNSIVEATEVKDLFRVIRTIADDGVRDLTSGDYYDYYRTSLYWETSIPAQLEYRKAILDVLKKYESNSSGYLSRMRDGG